MNYLVQNTDIDDEKGLVDDVVDLLAEALDGEVPSLSAYTDAFGEVIFGYARNEIEEYLDEFGLDYEVNSPEDITQEILEITGVRIPFISEFTAEKLLFKYRICYRKMNGELVNLPFKPILGPPTIWKSCYKMIKI
jgi:hypothetical protein